MFLELCVDAYRPRTLPAAEKRVADIIGERQRISPLLGWWNIDVGPLNRAVHIWWYESSAAREEALGRARQIANWPPSSHADVVEHSTTLFEAAPFSPGPLGSGFGVCELRLYTYAPGDIDKVIQKWGSALPERVALAPLAAAGRSNDAGRQVWLHLWAFKDAGERQRLRADAARNGIWPPSGMPAPLAMRNMLLLPAPFSPLR